MRRGRYRLGGLVVLALLALAAALAWLAASEPGLRFIARQAVSLSSGKLDIRGVQGSLYGPLRIEALSLRSETKRFDVVDARFDWSPRALWQRHLQINQLALAELRITELKPDLEPLQRPETLRLPFSLSIPAASLDRLIIKTGAGERTFNDLRLSLDKPERRYRLALHRLVTPWGQVEAQANLGDAPPFTLAGQVRFEHASGSAAAKLAGELGRMQLKASAALAGGRAEADILLTPFAHRTLTEAQIDAAGIDPARWDATWPRADLSLTAKLRSQGEHRYTGDITARNSQPGSWDQKRLPLREVAAQFSATADAMDLTDLRLDLARAGRFSGSGRAEPGALTLDLHSDDFDPHGLHAKLHSLRLAGTLRLQADRERRHLTADLGYQRYRLTLDAEQREQVVHIKQAVLASSGGSLSLFGSLGLDDRQAFDLAGALERFDPAAFGDYPQARINASFNARGQLNAKPETALIFAIADSQFRRQALSGQGNLRLSAQRLWDSAAELRLAGNQLKIQGAFGAAGDQLTFQIRADQLGIVHSQLSGQVFGSGKLAGRLAEPAGAFEIAAKNLAWGRNYRLASLQADASLEQGLNGNLALNARLGRLQTPQFLLDRADVQAQGRREQHRIDLTVNTPEIELSAELAGALRTAGDRAGWSGQILRLANRGRHPLTLQAPARLELAPDRAELAQAQFAAFGAAFTLQDARYQSGQFNSRGAFTGLALSVLKRLPAWPENIDGDLVLGGAWQIDAGEQANGQISLARERGDLRLATAPDAPTALGLQRLSLQAEARDSKLHASLDAAGSKLGRLRVQGESRLSRRDGVWGIAADAPLQGSADLILPSLAWAAPYLDDSGRTVFDGSLSAQVQASGSLAAPRFSGALSGEHFQLALPEQGLNFRDGRFQAELKQDVLTLQSLSLRGGDGLLTGQGKLGLRGGQNDLQLTFNADKLQVVSRPDRLLILSGGGHVALQAKKLQLRAKLKADRGQIELAKADAPSLSSDVVVRGREHQAAAKGVPYAVDMELDLDLGDRFFLKGRGLDARLGGAVKVSARQGAPLRANGSIRVVKGAYAAYGQRLDIDRGILNFQGPLDNPGLNIRALRKNQEVEAGVAITGSAQAPVVKLVSNPSVPDSEKLSWLVLGHGLSNTGSQEFDALQLAAGALLGAGESVTLQQRIAQAAGLEEVSLKGAGTLESSVLTLGKRLSARAYLSYEQSLTGSETLVKINYQLSRRLALRTQAGTTPAVDLFYTFSFD